MKVLVTARLGEAELKRRLAEQVGNQAIWVQDGDAMIPELSAADVLICPDNFYSAKLADAVGRDAPKLAFVQLLTAGYDNAKRQGVPAHVTLCNAGAAYASAVATHAIALLLALQRHIPTALANQTRHAWDRAFTPQLTMPAAKALSSSLALGRSGERLRASCAPLAPASSGSRAVASPTPLPTTSCQQARCAMCCRAPTPW
jgi:phosphoglycerate dehydrogenase-like enzyme